MTFSPDQLYQLFFAVLGGLVPPAIWLLFWLKEDKKKPEPKRLILLTFLAGAGAVFAAILLEKGVINLFHTIGIEPSGVASGRSFFLASSLLFAALALIEEGLKYLAVHLAVFHDRHFDEPIDPMIYLITGALGFAAMENILFLSGLIGDGSLSDFLLTGNFRFLGATVLHTVSSAVLGAFVSFGFCFQADRRRWYLALGLITATVLHALFNFFIIFNGGSHAGSVLFLLWAAVIFVIFLFEKVKQIICNLNNYSVDGSR